MKTIQEQIEIMQHYANGGEVEIFSNDNWVDAVRPGWNWNHCDYRIKEQKKTITIEKWLVRFDDDEYRIMDSSDLEKTIAIKVKLLETYEVEL